MAVGRVQFIGAQPVFVTVTVHHLIEPVVIG
jgi:hypothetical protein